MGRGLLFAVLLGFSGCSSLLEKVVEKPKVTLDRVEVADVSFSKAKLMFVVKVENPNGIDLKVDEVNYKIFLEDKAFTSAKTEKAVNVPARGSAEIGIPVPVEYKGLWTNLMKIFDARTVSYRIEGDAKLSLFTIPFSHAGKLELTTQ
ncbi:MAG TPA: LEA type 2 family protein [Pseudobdellovibrionaceae bacterium]|nr:LEA type 2 family protein [Pseudobdellovibrionaceae bacterium]